MGRRVIGSLRSGSARDVSVAIIVIAIAAGLYQLLAILAMLSHRRLKPGLRPNRLPVSILKPVYGQDAGFYDAIRTHALQQYPEFEIIFGIRRADDPARLVRDLDQMKQYAHS